MSPSIAIGGRHYPVSFTTRTYGTDAKTTYSWGFVTIGDERVSLGDPFPGRRWPTADLRAAVQTALGARTAQ